MPHPRRRPTRPAARLRCDELEARSVPAAVGVDAAANVHAINPNVYGTAFATTAQLADLNVPLNRNGGNASDTYSYPQDATNHASDWYFESIAAGTGNGQGIDSYVSNTKAGGAQPSLTVNLFDWAAKLGAGRSNLGSFPVSKYGAQQATDPYASNWGNGVHTDGTNVTGNDPNDAYLANSPTAEQAWIQHLINTFGDSQHGGVQYYTMGNEPGLWNSTHRDIHPAGDTLPELRDRIISYASMIKALDPGAKILGPEEWGWTNYFISGADAAAQNWGATYNGLNAEAWLLDQLRQHDAATGQRLLDYFTLHYYPQGGEFGNDVSRATELLRNQSTRSLWDPNYVDQSWIASTGIDGGKVNLINRMKAWVNSYYPGTKIGITEYNWGAEGDMNGATTQADVWGIFGREGLDLANRWTTPATGSPTYLAMKLFRNYDGAGSGFGDTSVGATVGNPDQVDAFASVRSSDGALTVMVVNKNLYDPANPSAQTPVTVNLSNFANGGVAREWQLAATSPADQTKAAITHPADVPFTGNSFTVSVPMESVQIFVIPRASAAPAAPSNLAATTVSAAQINLTWADNSGNETGFAVDRATDPAFTQDLTTATAGANATALSETGLDPGTTYYFRVRATNAAGASANSNTASATTGKGTGTGDGLAGTYFDNIDFTGARVTRVDPTVNFNWGTGAPAAGIQPGTYSVRWAGDVQAVETGTYTFRTYSEDGVRLWVNGQEIVNDWTDHGPTYDTGTIALQAGQRYAIRLEYYQDAAGAVIQLGWLRPGQTGYAVVPKSDLFSGGVTTGGPAPPVAPPTGAGGGPVTPGGPGPSPAPTGPQTSPTVPTAGVTTGRRPRREPPAPISQRVSQGSGTPDGAPGRVWDVLPTTPGDAAVRPGRR